MIEQLIAFDKTLFFWLNRDSANAVFDLIFPYITNGKFWIIPGTALATWYALRNRFSALWVLGIMIFAVALTDPVCARFLKPFFGRLRPCHPSVALEGGNFLIGMKRSFAFPSNHAANMGALATVLIWFHRRYWYGFVSFALLIGFSRIYTGVHYPADVLAGFIVGSMCAMFVLLIAILGKELYVRKRE